MAQEYTEQQDRNGHQQEEAAARSLLSQQVLGKGNGNHDNYDYAVAPQPQRRMIPTRSTPIAIARGVSGAQEHPDTSDDDDDIDSVIDVELDALKISGADGDTSRSLPGRLLRAPFLGSVPSNEERVSYHNMLPPAMAMPEQPTAAAGGLAPVDSGQSYGSLRDSHMRGRFLDGPSSYRDKRTGDIRSVQHRVRFRDNTTIASSAPSHSISIGERIMLSRKRQTKKGAENSNEDRASSLSAMLEGTDDGDTASAASGGQQAQMLLAPIGVPLNQEPSTFYEEDRESQYSSNMLSTSLTGLEVLQRAVRFEPDPKDVANDGEQWDRRHTELPRDANGHNSLLSRSLSDPITHLRHANFALDSNSPALRRECLAQPRSPPSFALSGTTEAVLASTHQQFAFPPTNFQQGGEQSEAMDDNPDMEGAFELDI